MMASGSTFHQSALVDSRSGACRRKEAKQRRLPITGDSGRLSPRMGRLFTMRKRLAKLRCGKFQRRVVMRQEYLVQFWLFSSRSWRTESTLLKLALACMQVRGETL